jgi:hypothetical protein
MNLKYTVNDFGVYRLDYTMKDNGEHTVFIGSETVQVGDLKVREVWALAYLSDQPLTGEQTLRLLKENGRTMFGAWEVRQVAGKDGVIFRAQIADDLSPENLSVTIRSVLLGSYEMKKNLGSKHGPQASAR